MNIKIKEIRKKLYFSIDLPLCGSCMKIKQVEELVGITSKNIRFYENQGLLTPERAENGYREYHQKNIDTLKKIKLLRKLGISVEEIKSVLNESVCLDECLERHKDILEKERENLMNMQNLTDAILGQKSTIGSLDTDKWLDEMERMEKEGIDFVNLSKVDVHMKKKMGAVIGGVVMILLMLFLIGIFIWENSMEPIPTGLFVIFVGIPSIVIICIIVALRSRLKEIEGGEEDEARQIAVKRMVDEAKELGADAVIGIKYGSSQVMAGAAEVIAYGTAVKIIE